MRDIRTIDIVDIDAAGGIDPARLRGALRLTVQRIGRGQYRITGGEEPHHVDLMDPAVERCDCGDFLWRSIVCQHLLACLLREGDERVIVALSRLIATMECENERCRSALRVRAIPLTKVLVARVAAALRIPAQELAFKRDPERGSNEVAVLHESTGELLGRISRELGAPRFVRKPCAIEPREAA
jgi:hypothetical protein